MIAAAAMCSCSQQQQQQEVQDTPAVQQIKK